MARNKEITLLAKTNFHGQGRLFGIKTDDRRRHMHVIGKTGMGKTSLLLNMAVSDIRNGNGLAFVDPHGDVAEDLLNYIPPERMKDVIYFNPQDLDFPLAFNVLGDVPRNQRHIVADGLVGVFKKIWADSWGPRLEYILRNAILTLLESEDSTLLDIMRILVDKDFRAHIVYNSEDPMLKSFWLNEFEGYGDKMQAEAIAPIQNKVGQFTSSPLIRNIIGQKKSSFNIRELMDTRKILLMNLSKGAIGEGGAQLLGAMMVTKMQLAAMSRVDIPQEQRQDFFVYIDEFQNFSTDSFAEILSEARKYRLSLILAHQYIEQLSDEVKAAVFGNVGTTVVFRIGATDAEEFEKEFAPLLTVEDFVNLPKYKIYLKLMIDGVTSEPFSADTLPDPPKEEVSIAEQIIAFSQKTYGNPTEQFAGKQLDDSGPKKSIHMTSGETQTIDKSSSDRPKFSDRAASNTQKPSSAGGQSPQRNDRDTGNTSNGRSNTTQRNSQSNQSNRNDRNERSSGNERTNREERPKFSDRKPQSSGNPNRQKSNNQPPRRDQQSSSQPANQPSQSQQPAPTRSGDDPIATQSRLNTTNTSNSQSNQQRQDSPPQQQSVKESVIRSGDHRVATPTTESTRAVDGAADSAQHPSKPALNSSGGDLTATNQPQNPKPQVQPVPTPPVAKTESPQTQAPETPQPNPVSEQPPQSGNNSAIRSGDHRVATPTTESTRAVDGAADSAQHPSKPALNSSGGPAQGGFSMPSTATDQTPAPKPPVQSEPTTVEAKPEVDIPVSQPVHTERQPAQISHPEVLQANVAVQIPKQPEISEPKTVTPEPPQETQLPPVPVQSPIQDVSPVPSSPEPQLEAQSVETPSYSSDDVAAGSLEIPEETPLNPILAKKLKEIYSKSSSPFGGDEYLIKAKVMKQKYEVDTEPKLPLTEFYDEILGELADKLMKPNPESLEKQEQVREMLQKKKQNS